MGLKRQYLDFIEFCIREFAGKRKGMRMLELGNQHIRGSDPEDTGKRYFSDKGFDHVSVDINGLDGARALDLSKPLPKSWHGTFDVATNSGTSEHVEPYEAQPMVFRNIHDCLMPGGIAIHLVPDADNYAMWPEHCRYYYKRSFFDLIASLNGYDTLANTTLDGMLAVCHRKKLDKEFSFREYFIVQ